MAWKRGGQKDDGIGDLAFNGGGDCWVRSRARSRHERFLPALRGLDGRTKHHTAVFAIGLPDNVFERWWCAEKQRSRGGVWGELKASE